MGAGSDGEQNIQFVHSVGNKNIRAPRLTVLQAKFEQFEEGSSNALPSYFEHHLPGNCGLVKLPCGVGVIVF